MKIHGGFDLINIDADLTLGATIPGLYDRCAKMGDNTIKIGGYTLSGETVEAEDASISKDAYDNYVITSAEHIVTVSSANSVTVEANQGGGGSQYVLPAATADTLGGIKVGSGLAVTEEGVLSATGGGGGSFDGVYVIEDAVFTTFMGNLEANIEGIYLDLVNSPRPVVLVDTNPDSSSPYKCGRIYEIQYNTSVSGGNLTGYGFPEITISGDAEHGYTAALSSVRRITITSNDSVRLDTVSFS